MKYTYFYLICLVFKVLRNDFRRPRDVLLSLVTDFVTSCTARLTELNKKYPQDGKVVELLDLRSHLVSITLHFLRFAF